MTIPKLLRPLGILAFAAACDGETETTQRMTSGPAASDPSTVDASLGGGGSGAGGTSSASGGSSAGGAGGSGGSVASGGAAGAPGAGGDDAPDAEAKTIVREPPPGVELVPGPAPPPPDGPRLGRDIDYSGYPDGLPSGYTAHCDGCTGRFGSGTPDGFPDPPEPYCCSCCTDEEFCFQNTRTPPTCSTPDPVIGTPASTCKPLPSTCTDDCPVVCGCDDRLYCNACIANAWGHDITLDSNCEAP